MSCKRNHWRLAATWDSILVIPSHHSRVSAPFMLSAEGACVTSMFRLFFGGEGSFFLTHYIAQAAVTLAIFLHKQRTTHCNQTAEL